MTRIGRVADAVRNSVLPDVHPLGAPEAHVTAEAARSGFLGASRVGRLIVRLALIAAVALLIGAIGLFTFRATYADRVYPAVAVGDVNVGGMTIDEAVATIEQRAADLERGTISLTYNGTTWTPTLSEIGASVDVDASVEAAYALGRGDNAVSRLGFTSHLLHGNQRVPLRTTVDREVLHGWFESVNTDIDQRAIDASLVVDGGEVRISPDHTGTVVDEAAATEIVLEALTHLEPVAVKLPTRTEHPKIVAEDLEQPRADLVAALDSSLRVVFEGQEWEIPPDELAQYLTVETVYAGGGASVELSFTLNELESYLRQTFSGRVNRMPEDARIAWSSNDGGLIALEPSVDGAALRSNAFADAVADSFLGDQAPVDIPVVVTKPKIDSNNLAALGIDGRIARGTSNFAGGGYNRDNNIYVGTELLNGELIAPGEEFSFNGAVGEITYDKGYLDAGVIENGIIGRNVGGGICQVSTTVFRAALFSGMPITEWHPHSLRLLGYERDGWTAGYDASILQSGSDPANWGDFRFKNDTDGYMLVQAWTAYPHVIVEIYGNDDGRQVEVGDAQFAENGQRYVAWFSRVVTYTDGAVNEQLFESVYS